MVALFMKLSVALKSMAIDNYIAIVVVLTAYVCIHSLTAYFIINRLLILGWPVMLLMIITMSLLEERYQ